MYRAFTDLRLLKVGAFAGFATLINFGLAIAAVLISLYFGCLLCAVLPVLMLAYIEYVESVFFASTYAYLVIMGSEGIFAAAAKVARAELGMFPVVHATLLTMFGVWRRVALPRLARLELRFAVPSYNILVNSLLIPVMILEKKDRGGAEERLATLVDQNYETFRWMSVRYQLVFPFLFIFLIISAWLFSGFFTLTFRNPSALQAPLSSTSVLQQIIYAITGLAIPFLLVFAFVYFMWAGRIIEYCKAYKTEDMPVAGPPYEQGREELLRDAYAELKTRV